VLRAVYKGCTPGAHRGLIAQTGAHAVRMRCAFGVHPVCTPCTRLWSLPGPVPDSGVGCVLVPDGHFARSGTPKPDARGRFDAQSRGWWHPFMPLLRGARAPGVNAKSIAFPAADAYL
jgi:hypothetical protein